MSRVTRGFVAFVLVGCSAQVTAESPFGDKRFTLELGAFLSDFDTSVRLSGPNAGSGVTLEDRLGLDDNQTSFRGEFTWRFADRHRVNVGWYEFKRKSRGRAQRAFVVETEDGTLEFDTGVGLDTEFNWRLIPITYSYSFIQNERFELAGAAGLHVMRVKFGVEGFATINGNMAGFASESETVSAPLPVLGLDATYAITPNWLLRARGQWFGLDYDDYSGELTDFRVATEYRFGETWGIGIGYTRYDIDFEEDNGRFKFEFDYNYEGPEAFVTVSF